MCLRFKVDVANRGKGHADQLNRLKDMDLLSLYIDLYTIQVSNRQSCPPPANLHTPPLTRHAV